MISNFLKGFLIGSLSVIGVFLVVLFLLTPIGMVYKQFGELAAFISLVVEFGIIAGIFYVLDKEKII